MAEYVGVFFVGAGLGGVVVYFWLYLRGWRQTIRVIDIQDSSLPDSVKRRAAEAQMKAQLIFERAEKRQRPSHPVRVTGGKYPPPPCVNNRPQPVKCLDCGSSKIIYNVGSGRYECQSCDWSVERRVET